MIAKKARPSKKMVPLSEVGGALVSYAEEHASPQRASEVEAEVQKFIDALPDAAPTPALDAAHDRFLARAKKLVSAGVYRQLEQAYRASKKAQPSKPTTDALLKQTLELLAQTRTQLAAAQARAAEHLIAIQKMVDEHRKYRAEEDAEISYWMGEVTRLNHELIEIHRERARDGLS